MRRLGSQYAVRLCVCVCVCVCEGKVYVHVHVYIKKLYMQYAPRAHVQAHVEYMYSTVP